jgi:cell division protein FtsI (penicillin-binding protein 3)
MDPRSADVLAVAEAPRFDPNEFRTTPYGKSGSRSFLDATEPGSTLKTFAVAAALEHRVVSRHELIDCEGGHFRIPGKTLRDTHPHGLLDPGGILQVSSNIGAAKLAFRVGREQHEAVLRQLGFGRPTGSGFPDESAGLLRPSTDWRPVDHATVAFGHGINVTAIQLASAVSALASDGVWRTPRLVAARRVPGGPWRDEPPSHGQRALRPEVARAVLEMLEGVVHPDVTASRAGLRDLRVAGKTGTAQKFDLAAGTYSTKRYGAWFVGVAPADDPRLVVVAMVDEPMGRGHTGGATAAPLFARVAAAGLAREGLVTEPEFGLPSWARIDEDLPPKPEPAKPAPKPVQIAKPAPADAAQPNPASPAPSVAAAPPLAAEPVAEAPAPRDEPVAAAPRAGDVQVVWLEGRLLLPDFRGLTPQEVRRITVNTPLTMELSGSGTAVAQEPEPGAILGEAARVRIRFARREGEG